MDLSQYAELFLAESREHLSACNHLLLEWERNPDAPEPVGGIFRAVHTVKGMAATMGYARVTEVAHRFENLLDLLRRGAHPATEDVLQLLFRARDALHQAVELSVEGRERELALAEIIAELDHAAGRVAPAAPGGRASSAAFPPAPPAPAAPAAPAAPVAPASFPGPVASAPLEASSAPGRLVRVVLRPEAPLKGVRALLVLRKAESLGAVHGVTPPPLALEAEDFDGNLAFRLESSAPAEQVERTLRAAGDVERVTVGGDELPGPGRGGGGEAGEAGEVVRSRHTRVDRRRLDALMDLIGELVTARGRLSQLAAERRDPAIDDVAIQVSRLSSDLQAEIIQARMTPVWQLFDRFPRLIRDLARELGKQVAFRVEGKEIELDRAILDELGDPLLHLLRNAVDHGVESQAERRRRGKKPEAEIVLAAVRERGSVAISVSDDGRGIDRKKILERAQRDRKSTRLNSS